MEWVPTGGRTALHIPHWNLWSKSITATAHSPPWPDGVHPHTASIFLKDGATGWAHFTDQTLETY